MNLRSKIGLGGISLLLLIVALIDGLDDVRAGASVGWVALDELTGLAGIAIAIGAGWWLRSRQPGRSAADPGVSVGSVAGAQFAGATMAAAPASGGNGANGGPRPVSASGRAHGADGAQGKPQTPDAAAPGGNDNGLLPAIERRFAEWGLTPSEREVAYQLLRGSSTDEIAAAQGVSAKTVRHHNSAIYQKAGLKGRAELAGVFLKTLLDAPRYPAPPAPPRAEPLHSA